MSEISDPKFIGHAIAYAIVNYSTGDFLCVNDRLLK